MPIYAYRCSACGHQKDVLQKIADAPLTVCPACGQSAFSKQITAAGFQLKGNGWYATDFKSKSAASAAPAAASASETSTNAAASTDSSASTPSAHSCGTGGCGSCT